MPVLASIISGAGPIIASIAGNAGAERRQNRTSKAVNKSAQDLFRQNAGKVTGEFKGMDEALTDLQGLSEMYKNQSNLAYSDTTEGKALTSQIDRNSDKQRKRLSEDANTMGLSHEAYLAGLGKINESEGSAMSDLAAGADRRRESMNANRRGVLNQLLAGFGSKAGMKNQMYGNAYGNAAAMFGQNQQQQQNAMNNLNSGFQSAGMLASMMG